MDVGTQTVTVPEPATFDMAAEMRKRFGRADLLHLRTLISYARWQVNEGSSHHPTLPSAISAAKTELAEVSDKLDRLDAFPAIDAEMTRLRELLRKEQDENARRALDLLELRSLRAEVSANKDCPAFAKRSG